MKKIVILLLALSLLLPALALAEDLPTFDFTAEEWLARYQEVVGEDSELWVDELGGSPTYNLSPILHNGQVVTIGDDEGGKIHSVRVFVRDNDFSSGFLKGDDFYATEYPECPNFITYLLDMYTAMIVATTDATEENASTVLLSLGVDRECWDYSSFAFGAFKSVEIDGCYFYLDATSGRITMGITTAQPS